MGKQSKQQQRKQAVDSLQSDPLDDEIDETNTDHLGQQSPLQEDEELSEEQQLVEEAELAGKKRSRNAAQKSSQNAKKSKLIAKSDDECDDDELIDKLEQQHKQKREKPAVDLDKMTRRQRMAYLAQQGTSEEGAGAVGGGAQQVSITGGALDQLTGDDNVLYSLGTRKTRMLGEDGMPLPKPKKTQISQQQADEIKRKEFLKILEEQQKKIKDREVKMKLKQTGVMSNAGGPGRPANNMSLGGGYASHCKKDGWRPGMEQFVNAIKLKIKKDKVSLCMPQGFKLPEVLRQKPASDLQQKIQVRRSTADCYSCKKPDARKYTCAKTQRVTCSFECYKAALPVH